MVDISNDLINQLKDNQEMQTKVLSELEVLPKGHINTLYRNKKGYYYLTYRVGQKIKNDYLGPVGKCDISDTIYKLNQRSKLKKQLSNLKAEEVKIKKQIKKTNAISQE